MNAQPVDLLVLGGPLLPMDEAGSFFPDGAVAIADGRIVAAGEARAVSAQVTASERLDAAGKAILPGFVNCHGHAGMILLRGLAEEFPLQRWLSKTVWPLMQHAGPEETYAGARLACVEMIRAGITSFTDMWRDLPATVQAVEESGLRARLAFNMRDFSDPARLESEWAAGFDAVGGRVARGRVRYGLAPHSLYACSDSLLRRCADTVSKLGCHLQIHVAETERETLECKEKHGRSPVERLDDLGLLGARTLLAHGVWLDEEDCRRVARAGAAIAHNVTSNLKLASGTAPLSRFHAAGITVGLGTDSAASNNVLDPFREMKYAALLQRAAHRDPMLFPPRAMIAAATREGARALALADQVGSLEAGKQADLILIDLDKPHLAPGPGTDSPGTDADTLMALIVFAATAADVDTTIVGGRILMRGRRVLGLDVPGVMQAAQAAATRLLQRAGA
jgi:5-methylthioadenosine/S-adenosylhomocysteine deaminase